MAKKKHEHGKGINDINPTPLPDLDIHYFYGAGNGGYGGPEVWGPSPFANQSGMGISSNGSRNTPPKKKKKK